MKGLKPEVLTTLVDGLKEAGIDFVTSLPSSSIGDLIMTVSKDRHFTHVPVANEEDAIAIACGAWLGGKKPAVMLQNSGLMLAIYALLDSIYFYGGFPILLVVEHKGDFYDNSGYWFYGYGTQLPKILENFQIPYTIVREKSKLKAELVYGARTAVAFGRPAAVLFSGEEVNK